MIDRVKPYSAMKDSGVPWLGELPEHWEVSRLKYLLRERDVRSAAGAEQLLRVSQFTGVTERRRADGRDEPDTRAASLVGYKLVEPDDLVVNIMLAWNGSMGVSRFSGITSPAYCVYRFNASARPGYFHYLLRSPAYKARIKAVSTGVVESRLRLYSDDLYRLEAVVPPLPEQHAIVRFLDHVDRKVRRYIRAKQKLIALLEEEKQAIIHQAVTRGLDPNVRLKPSGVEWLGDVPEHWTVRSLGRCLEGIDQGWSPNAAESELSEDQWAVLTLSAIRRGTFDSTSLKPIADSSAAPAELEIREGDLLLTRSNTRDRVGDAALVTAARPRTIFSDLMFRLRVNRGLLHPSFLLWQLLGYVGRRQIESDARGSSDTMPKISQVHIRAWTVLVPSLDEQSQIVTSVAPELLSRDCAVRMSRAELALMNEYHTRLIADVVTGKLDVREAAARLPEDLDESGAIQENVDLDVEGEGEEEIADVEV